VGAGIFVNLLPSLVNFTAQNAVIWPDQLINLEGIISLVVSDNLRVSIDILGCKSQLNIVLHCLSELRVALVDEHDFLGVLVLESLNLAVCDGDTVQFLHVLLARDVTAGHHVLLEVYSDAAAGDEVLGGDLVVWVVRGAEQLASLLVEVVAVHLEFLGGVVDAWVGYFDVDELEVVVADAVAQVILAAVVALEAEVEGGQALWDVVFQVVVLVTAAQGFFEVQLEFLVVFRHEFFGGSFLPFGEFFFREFHVGSEVKFAAWLLAELLFGHWSATEYFEGYISLEEGQETACLECNRWTLLFIESDWSTVRLFNLDSLFGSAQLLTLEFTRVFLEWLSDFDSVIFDLEIDLDFPHAEFFHAWLDNALTKLSVEDNKAAVVWFGFYLGALLEVGFFFRLSLFEHCDVVDVTR
jgi:hypothetical protein